MNFILRIINQNLDQTQISVNTPLEGGYCVISKVNNTSSSSEPTPFERAVENYFEGIPCTDFEKESVVMVVSDMSNKYPSKVIKNTDVAYVVNEEGKTVERLYGMYVKY